MNKLIPLVRKENSLYILAAIIESCNHDGILNTNHDTYKIIIDKYLDIYKNGKAKTPANTINTMLRYQKNGQKYFDTSNTKVISLLDTTDLLVLKQEAIRS